MPAEDDDIPLPFRLPSLCNLPSLCKKKVTAAFDGGTISLDGGGFLLACADRRIGLIDRLAALFPDTRDSAQVIHSMADLLRERFFAIVPAQGDRRINAFWTMRWLDLTAKAESQPRQLFRTAVSEPIPTPGRYRLSDGTACRAMIPIQVDRNGSAGVGAGRKADATIRNSTAGALRGGMSRVDYNVLRPP